MALDLGKSYLVGDRWRDVEAGRQRGADGGVDGGDAVGLFVWDLCDGSSTVQQIIRKLAKEYEGRVKFAKLNVDEAPQTASAYGIRSIPTIALFRNGEPVNGVMGAVPERVLAEMLDAELAK